MKPLPVLLAAFAFLMLPASAQTAKERLDHAIKQYEKERATAMKQLDEKFDAILEEIIKQAAVENDESTQTLASALLEGGQKLRDPATSRTSAAEPFTPKALAAKELMMKDLTARFTIDDSGIMTTHLRVEAFEPTFAFAQLKGNNPVSLSVDAVELVEADHLNGITWKGFVSADFTSLRMSKQDGDDGVPIWDEWKAWDKDCSFFYSIVEKKGQLQIESRIIDLGYYSSVYGDSAEKKMLPDSLDISTDEP